MGRQQDRKAGGFDLENYNTVAERIVEFRTKYPEGSLQSEILPSPVEGFVVVKAYAYRTPDDQRPGVGLAWEPVPGPTQFTKDSELQNAETAAWGRAIVAVGAAETRKGIATAEDVRNRTAPSPATDEQMAELSRLLGLVDAEVATRTILQNTGQQSLDTLTIDQAAEAIKWLKQAEQVPA